MIHLSIYCRKIVEGIGNEVKGASFRLFMDIIILVNIESIVEKGHRSDRQVNFIFSRQKKILNDCSAKYKCL